MSSAESYINDIEKILLPKGCSFDSERRDFILENNESHDLVACAGSGKTTALLAKLLLLEKGVRRDKGICVLTHTNVAIDEVKSKISPDSVLLNQPNHFSTIQQFVDKFLTIPAYRHLTGKNLVQIDTDQTHKRFVNNFFNLPPDRQAAFFSYRKMGNTQDDKLKLLKSGVEYVMGIGEYHYQFRNIHNKKAIPIKSGETFTTIKSAKDPVFRDGYITYEEAYHLANWYLEKYPFIKKCIADRFSHVFLDEMQDTSDLQEKLLEKIFDESVVVQRIGDPNQTIYDSPSENETEWQPSATRKNIKGSLRLSPATIKAISGVRSDDSEEMYGNDDLPSIKPYILTFSEGQETEVIDFYKEILKKHAPELNYKNSDTIKVVGWTGKNKDSLCIPKYCPSFTNSSSRNYLANFNSYKTQFEEYYREEGSLRTIKKTILTIFTQLLFELNIKNNGRYYSQKEVITALENRAFEQQIFLLTLSIARSEGGWLKVKHFITQSFLSLFLDEEEQVDSDKLNEFLEGESEIVTSVDNQENYYFELPENGIKIPIGVSTIHAVKGETHKSTLYLETKYYKHDVERLLKNICGTLGQSDKLDNKRKMMGYVAMSRASHLLCVAVRDAVVDKSMEKTLTDIGWQVVRN